MPNEKLTGQQQFGILSPQIGGGVREDMPNITLEKAFSPESENVIVRHGEVQRLRGRLKEFLDSSNDKVKATDENPIIKYHRHITTAGIEYEFAFTKAHAYLWNSATLALDLMFTCTADCELWSVISGKTGDTTQGIIATNGIDYVQVWHDSTPATAFAALDTATGLDLAGTGTKLTTAKYVVGYENYTVFLYTTEGGTVYPNRGRWSTLNTPDDYDENGTGDTGAVEIQGGGFIKGAAKYGTTFEYLMIFKTKSVRRFWLVTGDDVFNNAIESSGFGLLATNSLVRGKEGGLYFIASDYTARELRSGIISRALDKTIKNINVTYEADIAGTYIDEYEQVWWSIPYGDSATGLNRVAFLNPPNKTWGTVDVAIRAFGDYSRQTAWTIDTWPYATIDGISQPTIDDVENIVGFPLDLASDYDGYTYSLHQAETDDGDDYTGTFVMTTDLADKQAVNIYKRVNEISLFFKREGTGTALLYVKRDNEANWQEVDSSIDLTSDGAEEILEIKIPCDIRAKHFLFRITGTNAFRFIGLISKHSFDGDR